MGIAACRGRLQVGKRDGIKVIIGKRQISKPEASQLDNLFDYGVYGVRTGALSISAPD